MCKSRKQSIRISHAVKEQNSSEASCVGVDQVLWEAGLTIRAVENVRKVFLTPTNKQTNTREEVRSKTLSEVQRGGILQKVQMVWSEEM